MLINVLFCGDVVGKSGRKILESKLPLLKTKYKIDFTVVNAENSAGGFGITKKIAKDIFNLGVDVITLGNHSFDKIEIEEYIKTEKRLLRPINYIQAPGNGSGIYTIKNYKIMVINILGKLYMPSKIDFDEPFTKIENIISNHKLKENVDAIIIDFHAETSSEKNAMGHFLNGRVSAVLGTHTHVPTSDARILNKGTAYQTDIGMCGDYNSVIGMKIKGSLNRFLGERFLSAKVGQKPPSTRLSPADAEGTVCATVLRIDLASGLCQTILPVIIGGSLCKVKNQMSEIYKCVT